MKSKKVRDKVFKGIYLDAEIAKFIKNRSEQQHRSFTSQVCFILEKWVVGQKENLEGGQEDKL